MANATLFEAITHAQTGIPKLVRVVIRCTANDAASGYSTNDEIDLESWIDISTDDGGAFGVVTDAVNVTVTRESNTAGNIKVMPKAGGPHVAPTALANFVPKVYAWA